MHNMNADSDHRKEERETVIHWSHHRQHRREEGGKVNPTELRLVTWGCPEEESGDFPTSGAALPVSEIDETGAK